MKPGREAGQGLVGYALIIALGDFAEMIPKELKLVTPAASEAFERCGNRDWGGIGMPWGNHLKQPSLWRVLCIVS